MIDFIGHEIVFTMVGFAAGQDGSDADGDERLDTRLDPIDVNIPLLRGTQGGEQEDGGGQQLTVRAGFDRSLLVKL